MTSKLGTAAQLYRLLSWLYVWRMCLWFVAVGHVAYCSCEVVVARCVRAQLAWTALPALRMNTFIGRNQHVSLAAFKPHPPARYFVKYVCTRVLQCGRG